MEEQRQSFHFCAVPQKKKNFNRVRKPQLPNSGRFHIFLLWVLVLCCALLLLLSLKIFKENFRPVLIVPQLRSALAASAFVQGEGEWRSASSWVKVEDRVIFPDHVLLLTENTGIFPEKQELDCAYHSLNSSGRRIFPVISVDNEAQLQIARCPLPPTNFSSMVALQRRGLQTQMDQNQKVSKQIEDPCVYTWETLAYEAFLDGNTAVVFVKGLNLRPDRASDPTHFGCHFDWDLEKKRFLLTTKAVTAAQEVVRCSLPLSLQRNPSKAQGIRVTVSAHERGLIPSVAKLHTDNNKKKKINWQQPYPKFKMCVCTMLWNQASFLREWIMYHGWLGVERWFIYDNNSDDQIQEVLQTLDPYNISRHVWPWIKTQEAGFSHCALRAKEECEWVGFMDVDEFFYFRSQSYPIVNYMANRPPLRFLLDKFPASVGEIRTACYSFGPSGLTEPPPRGVMAGYTCRLKSPERHKSIVRLIGLNRTLVNVIHHFHLRKGFRYVNLSKKVAVMNHYKYQAWEVFKAKFYRRVATYVADWQENQNEGSKDRAPGLGTEAIEPSDWPFQFCEVRDFRLRDFVLANLVDHSAETRLLPWEKTNATAIPALLQ